MKIPVTAWWDIAQANLVNSTTGSITNAPVPVCYRDSNVVIRIHCFDQWNTHWNLSNVVTWEADIGTLGGTSLVQAANSDFNKHSDWSAVNLAAGRICMYMQMDSAALDAALGTSAYGQFYLQVFGTDNAGLVNPLVVCPITVKNIVEHDTGESSSSSGDSSASSASSSQGSSASSLSTDDSSGGSSGSSSSGDSSASSSSQTA
jgi:uncharacterized membrane protein YgcG